MQNTLDFTCLSSMRLQVCGGNAGMLCQAAVDYAMFKDKLDWTAGDTSYMRMSCRHTKSYSCLTLLHQTDIHDTLRAVMMAVMMLM
jgi:hypothetical protein